LPKPEDTGSELRTLYASQGGVGEIFSAKVGDYVASRPDYPAALFDTLRGECRLAPGSLVADVGAGTGLLSRGLLVRGWRVVAVEPNAPMRDAAARLLGSYEGFQCVDGSAESMPVADSSVDLIAAAQAFHWFDVARAKAECLRVLRPDGQVALIWNDRVPQDPLHLALDEIFEEYGGAKRGALVAHEEHRDVSGFFGAATPKEFSWPHQHMLGETGLTALVFSRSYMPERDSPAGRHAVERVRNIFRRFAVGESLAVRYTTIAFLGRPQ
jgi:SAM-dependent methyltransferase